VIIVIGTNIIVSGLLKAFSDTARILALILSGKITLAYDSRIINEYEEVLKRKKFNFSNHNIEAIIAEIKEEGIYVSAVPLKGSLPDRDDEPFLEVALSGKINVLVTGNKKHFPEEFTKNVKILSPSEFLNVFKEQLS
jgi:putative toxin-antitoxin system toxin component, PIN family